MPAQLMICLHRSTHLRLFLLLGQQHPQLLLYRQLQQEERQKSNVRLGNLKWAL